MRGQRATIKGLCLGQSGRMKAGMADTLRFSPSAGWDEVRHMLGSNMQLLVAIAGVFFLLPGLVLSFTMPAITDISSLAAIAAKTSYPAACNAIETLLWVEGTESALDACVGALRGAGVDLNLRLRALRGRPHRGDR